MLKITMNLQGYLIQLVKDPFIYNIRYVTKLPWHAYCKKFPVNDAHKLSFSDNKDVFNSKVELLCSVVSERSPIQAVFCLYQEIERKLIYLLQPICYSYLLLQFIG